MLTQVFPNVAKDLFAHEQKYNGRAEGRSGDSNVRVRYSVGGLLDDMREFLARTDMIECAGIVLVGIGIGSSRRKWTTR